MDSTIKTQWLARLNDTNYIQAKDHLHTVGDAFDVLGLLCDIYLQANYHCSAGTVAVAYYDYLNIKTTRDTLVGVLVSLGAQGFGTNVLLDNALRDGVTSDILDPWTKEIIRTSWVSVLNEQGSLGSVSSNLLAVYDAIVQDPLSSPDQVVEAATNYNILSISNIEYNTAIVVFRNGLDTLSGPGGWRSATLSWDTDYTSVDTSSRWVNHGDDFYLINDFTDRLPEAVQRWARLNTSDPTLLVSDAYGFNGVTMPFFINKLNDGSIQKNVSGQPVDYTPAELAEMIGMQL